MLVPLKHPGVRVRRSASSTARPGFAEVFFDDARVPVANRLGEEGEGWNVAMATAGFERGLMLRSPARFQAPRRSWCSSGAATPRRPIRRCAATRRAGWMDAEAYALDTYRTVRA